MNMAHQFELGPGYACKARWLVVAWRRLKHDCYRNDQRSKYGAGGFSRSPYLVRSFVSAETGLTGILDRSLCYQVFYFISKGTQTLTGPRGFAHERICPQSFFCFYEDR